MYEYIKGTVAEVAPAYAVIDVGGVGATTSIFRSKPTPRSNTRPRPGSTSITSCARMRSCSTASRPRSSAQLFRLLISVSGVGGNTARMILSTYSPRELQGIITAGNAVLLKNVKGLGLKTAQKIIVELSGKLMAPGADDGGGRSPGRAGASTRPLRRCPCWASPAPRPRRFCGAFCANLPRLRSRS